MAKYLCVRCGHESSQIGDLKKHLNKAKECMKKYDETDRAILLKMLNNGSEYLKYLEIVLPLIKKLSSVISIESFKSPKKKFSVTASSNSIGLETKNIPVMSPISDSTSSLAKPIENKSYCCIFCGKSYNNRQNRWKHEKICDSRLPKSNNVIDNITNINHSNINSNNTTINNTNNTNNTLNLAANSPKMCVFGEEDISHIVKLDRINDYERIARRDPNKVIPTIVQDIYFNREHPENQTVKIEHIHGNIAMIRVGLPDEWEYVDRKDTINKMVKKGINAAETGKIDYDNLPKYDALVDNYYSEVNPYYNSTVKAIDTILVIDLKKTNSNRLLK